MEEVEDWEKEEAEEAEGEEAWVIQGVGSLREAGLRGAQARSTERTGQGLLGFLRELPSKQALALRSEVAKEVAAARAQRSALDKQLWSLTKKGF